MPKNRVKVNRNRRKGNGQNGAQRRGKFSDRHRLPSILESCFHGTPFGGFLNIVWNLIVSTSNNLDKIQNNDELLLKGKNEGDVQRKQRSYDAQYYQLTMWLLISRFLCVIAISTVFVPDEYFQGTEVAHWVVYGKGNLADLTWEWTYGLRGFLYPCFLAFPLWVMKSLKLTMPAVVVYGPRLMQAAVTCFAEYKFISYVRRKFGNATGVTTCGLLISNWFLLYCSSRTLTNTMEMNLNLLAFCYLQYESMGMFTICAALAFFIRPTAIIIWIPICTCILSKLTKNVSVFIHCFTIGMFMLYGNTLLDIHFYQKFVLPPLKFFQFNFLEGRSSEFGTHPMLWYVYSALPSIFGPAILWVISGLMFWPAKYTQHLSMSIVYLSVFSALGHKEIRFILPIIPHLLVVAADSFVGMQISARNLKIGIYSYMKGFFYVNILLHLGAAAFFGQLHQVGIKSATNEIKMDSKISNLSKVNIWILMPCYSVPVHTYLHYDYDSANYEFLTCSPPGFNITSPNPQTVDFSEFDFKQFIGSKLTNLTTPTARPDYVMTYGQRASEIISHLKDHGLDYYVMGKYYHTVLPFDNIGRNVQVLRVNDTSSVLDSEKTSGIKTRSKTTNSKS